MARAGFKPHFSDLKRPEQFNRIHDAILRIDADVGLAKVSTRNQDAADHLARAAGVCHILLLQLETAHHQLELECKARKGKR